MGVPGMLPVKVAATTTVAVVVGVVPPVPAAAVVTTIPVTAAPRADSTSKAGVSQLPSGLLKNPQIGSRSLGTVAEITAPVSCAPHPFHELNQMPAEIPQSSSSLQMSLGVGHQPC